MLHRLFSRETAYLPLANDSKKCQEDQAFRQVFNWFCGNNFKQRITYTSGEALIK